MKDSISFLLGAGFSAPKGYPTGEALNKLLLNCTGEEFGFHTDGRLVVTDDGRKPDFGYKTSTETEFDFCKKLIKYFYDTKGYFDYEEFYDFVKYEAKTDEKVKQIAKLFTDHAGNFD